MGGISAPIDLAAMNKVLNLLLSGPRLCGCCTPARIDIYTVLSKSSLHVQQSYHDVPAIQVCSGCQWRAIAECHVRWRRVLNLGKSPSKCDQKLHHAEGKMSTGCTKCDGTGKVLVYKLIDQFCTHCGGTGKVMPDVALSRGQRTPPFGHGSSVCPMCRGRGRAPTRTLVQVNCDTCKGKGQMWYQENFPEGQRRQRNAGDAPASDAPAFGVIPQMSTPQTTGRDCLGGVERPDPRSTLNQTFQ